MVAKRQTLIQRLLQEVVSAQKNFKYRAQFMVDRRCFRQYKGCGIGSCASRLVYDGGMLDAEIMAGKYRAEAARQEYNYTSDDRAFKLGNLWIDLERYEALHGLLETRLAVLEPLITQLEQVAKAGIGDVSKVAAAQRTVATVRVAHTTVLESLKQARLSYRNSFGGLPVGVDCDARLCQTWYPIFLMRWFIQRRCVEIRCLSAERRT